MRRIRNISISIPCVVGPYTNINCTLTLLNHKTRIDSNSQTDYMQQENDTRFIHSYGALESIATSNGQNDPGMFELNFRDERYLPFECTGAIGRWRIEMPKANNQFDFNTISDVILHMKYSARDGGKALGDKVQKFMDDNIPKAGVRLFNVKHEFPNEWHKFFHPIDNTISNMLSIELEDLHFPYIFQGKPLDFGEVQVVIIPKQDIDIMPKDPTYGNVQVLKTNVNGQEDMSRIILDENILDNVHNNLKSNGKLDSEKLENILLLLSYNIA